MSKEENKKEKVEKERCTLKKLTEDIYRPEKPKPKPIEKCTHLLALFASPEYKAMGKNDKDKARLHAFGLDNPELSAYTRNKLRKDFGKLKQHKNETIEVTLLKELAREMIMSCYPYNTIIMYLECCYGLSHDTAKNRVSTAALEFILSELFKDWKNMNLMRLDNILYKTYEAGKYGDAIKAIDTLNKMVGAYAPTLLEVTLCNAIF